MQPMYMAVPIRLKPKIPIALLPEIRFGKCTDCGGEVFYHGKAFDQQAAGWKVAPAALRIVCDQCAERSMLETTTVVMLPKLEKSYNKHFCQG
jgi:hypothetical protein